MNPRLHYKSCVTVCASKCGFDTKEKEVLSYKNVEIWEGITDVHDI